MDPSTWGNQVADQCLQTKVTSILASRASSRHDRKCDAATSLSDGVAITASHQLPSGSPALEIKEKSIVYLISSRKNQIYFYGK
jgi:hypothetical protein